MYFGLIWACRYCSICQVVLVVGRSVRGGVEGQATLVVLGPDGSGWLMAVDGKISCFSYRPPPRTGVASGVFVSVGITCCVQVPYVPVAVTALDGGGSR
jgi:hypothetical protein